jgi:putative Mn2+ efflux pump MntP
MGLDIRFPIGYMFSLVGLLLTIAGFIDGPEQLQRSLGININLIWGCFLIVFGAFMLIMAFRAKKATEVEKK